MKNNKGVDVCLVIFVTLVFTVGGAMLYLKEGIHQEADHVMNVFKKELLEQAHSDTQTYIATSTLKCMSSKKYTITNNNTHSYHFDKTGFIKDMHDVKTQCLTVLEDKALLINARAGSGEHSSDRKFVSKIQAFLL